MFLCLRIHKIYVEEAGLHLVSKECFGSFPFAQPGNIVSNSDTKCFCSNALLFAQALKATLPDTTTVEEVSSHVFVVNKV